MPTIKKPNQHFDATLYTQNGTATNVVTNAGGFQPDLVWIKCRSNAGTFHNLIDSVRGVSSALFSNSTAAQDTYPVFSSFNSNGFTLPLGDTGTNSTSGRTQVAWQWKAGGASTVNTSGSISSNVSVSTTAGFSVVTYTNTAGRNAHTFGHGLGVAPKMVIIKTISATADWVVYHNSLGSTKAVYLNQTLAQQTNSAFFNNTDPTSTVMTLGSGLSDAGVTIVAYCWAEIEGYSKFGSYTGNGSADGPFQYTGFRPKFVVIKKSSDVGEWAVFDGARETFNPEGSVAGRLRFNTSDAESGADSAQYMDFLSNGFKIRNTSGFDNDSGGTYVYMAFAEAPFKFSNAR